MLTRRLSCLALLMALATPAMATDAPTYSEKLEGFDYGWPVKHFTFTSQEQSLDMAYLDVKPEKPNGRTVVLMHGKNFCAGTWDGTIRALSASGYRVIAPDQIGFCKSSKPMRYQFSFAQLAANTRALLDSLDIGRSKDDIRQWKRMKRPEKMAAVQRATLRLKALKKGK